MNIYLIGYRGTGKSTVGKALAEKLARPFIDTDAVIVSLAGVEIAEIFATEGEAGFRKCEADVVQALQSNQRAVVALGGGAILDPQNREHLKDTGYTVWLKATPEVLLSRLTTDENTASQRPALSDLPMEAEIRKVLAAREPIYAEASQLSIDVTDATVEDVVAQLQERVQRGSW